MTKYKLSNGMRQCSSCQSVYPDTGEYFYKYHGRSETECKKCKSARSNERIKERRNSDPEFIQEVRDRSREWYVNNRGRKIEQVLAWQVKNIEKKRLIERRVSANRNAKKKGLPNTLTQEEIDFSLSFFGNKCAYCGTNLENSYHLDHFIPLKNENCPGTVAQNMLPVCPKCNHSKHAQEPVDWLNRKFGESVALEIIEKLIGYSISLKLKNESSKN